MIVNSHSRLTDAVSLRRQRERQRLVNSSRHVWTLETRRYTDIQTHTHRHTDRQIDMMQDTTERQQLSLERKTKQNKLIRQEAPSLQTYYLGEGKSYGVGDGTVGQGVAEFLQAVYSNRSTICTVWPQFAMQMLSGVSTPNLPPPGQGRPGHLSNTTLLGPHKCPCQIDLILFYGFSRVHECDRRTDRPHYGNMMCRIRRKRFEQCCLKFNEKNYKKTDTFTRTSRNIRWNISVEICPGPSRTQTDRQRDRQTDRLAVVKQKSE